MIARVLRRAFSFACSARAFCSAIAYLPGRGLMNQGCLLICSIVIRFSAEMTKMLSRRSRTSFVSCPINTHGPSQTQHVVTTHCNTHRSANLLLGAHRIRHTLQHITSHFASSDDLLWGPYGIRHYMTNMHITADCASSAEPLPGT